MEGKIASVALKKEMARALALALGIFYSVAWSQEHPAAPREEEVQLQLRKAMKTREYDGRTVEGEERVVQPGDSLWRILIQEKGLPQKRFNRYLVIIKVLNPHIKKPNVLEIGDILFIPIRPDEILGFKASAARREGRIYKVKYGDHLYQILREQLGLEDLNKILNTFEQVKDLNPGKKNWDLLFVGESIVLPGTAEPPQVTAAERQKAAVKREEKTPPVAAPKRVEQAAAAKPQEEAGARPPPARPSQPESSSPKPSSENVEAAKAAAAKPEPRPAPVPMEVVGLDYGRKIPAGENLDLLEQVMSALGNETRRGGEEVMVLRDGTVRLDLASYPMVQNPKRLQRVILDVGEKIPSSLKTQLKEERSAAPVMSVKKGASLHEAVAGLLTHLGFEPLPSNRPVVIHDKGVGIHVMGEWMVTAPDAAGAGAEIFVVSLTDLPGMTPDYLREYLSFKGMNLQEILIPPPGPSPAPAVFEEKANKAPAGESPIEVWPEDKSGLVDAFLNSYRIASAIDEVISVQLGEGIRLETKMERVFEFDGRKVGVSFDSLGDDVKEALQSKLGVKIVELDFAALSSREVIARLLAALERPAAYREHSFPAAQGKARNKLVLTVSGFLLPDRSMLLTDREVPKELQRFFAEKAIRVVYFK